MSKDAPAMGELPFSHVFFFFFLLFLTGSKQTAREMVGYASQRCRGVLKGQRGEVADVIFSALTRDVSCPPDRAYIKRMKVWLWLFFGHDMKP